MPKRKITHNTVLVGGIILAVIGTLIACIGTHTADAIGGVMILLGVIIAGIVAFLWYGYF